MKKSRSRTATLFAVGVGAALLWLVQSQGPQDRSEMSDLTRDVISIAEEIEARQIVDAASLNRSRDALGETCAAHAQDYSDYTYSVNALKVASLITGELEMPDYATQREQLSRLGTEYLDAGCPAGVLLQLIQRQKSVERFVNGAIYALAEREE